MVEITGSERLRFGPYEVDLHTRELWKHGTRVKLVGQPFDILAVLVKRSGQLVTRDELRAQLWPEDTFVDFNHGLNAAVNKLRDALCDSADDPKYIETLPRRGYRFLARVEPAGLQAVSAKSEAAPTRIRDVQPVTDISREPAQDSTPTTKSETRPPDVRTIAAGRKLLWLRRAGWLAGLIAILWLLVNIGIFDHLRAWRRESQEKKRTAENLGAGLARLTDVPDPTSDAAFSPEGNRVAFRREGNSRESSGLFVKAVHDSQLLQLTDHIEDCCPVFSPDGGSIAFSRFEGNKHSIFVIPSGGGAPRKLYTTVAGSKRGDLDWSPDGKTLAFVDQTSQGTSSIFTLSMNDLSVHRITAPPPLNHDWGPAFSPDGQMIAFVRTHETGLPQNIVIMPAGGGESRVVISVHDGILGPPTWTADRESLVFSSGAEPRLLRVSAFGTGETKEIPGVGVVAWHPSIARSGRRLAFQTSSKAVSVWQSDFQNDGGKLESRRLVVTDAGRNEGAQVSPDGGKLVFMSNRSGSMEIWVSDRDGSNPVQLTSVGAAGTPRWSPDGRSVVFDVTLDGRGAIFTVDLSGAPPRMLQQDNANNLVPNWSADGRWIYFASDRTGMWQVWKVPASGGAAVQITTSGGFAAYEFNHILYYSRFNMPNPEVWMMPVSGGPESLVSLLLRPETWAGWVPANGGIYFIHAEMNGQPGLMFFDVVQQQVSRVANLPSMPFWLAATPDGKTFLYEHLDQENNHIMLLENFQ